jgi:transketolase
VVTETNPVRVHRIGVPDTFAPTGSTSFLFEHFGLTAAAIRAAAVELVQKKA